MPGHEDQLVVADAARAPAQVMLDFGRLIILIDPEETDVEIEAGVLEVVRIAAEKGDVLLWREDQAHVGVLLVAIEVIQPALIEGHDVASHSRLLQRLFLDGVHHRLARPLLRLLGRDRPRGHGRINAGRHVLDAHQHVQFQVDALQLIGRRAGVEAGLDQIALRGAQLLQRIGPDVMVGHHQAAGRDKRTGAPAVEAHGRLLQMFEPGIGRIEAVLLLKLLARRLIEQPHPLVGKGVNHRNQSYHQKENNEQRATINPHTASIHSEG